MSMCKKCEGTGRVYDDGDLHRSVGFVPCEACNGTGNVAEAKPSDDERVDATFKRMFRASAAEGDAQPLESATVAPFPDEVVAQAKAMKARVQAHDDKRAAETAKEVDYLRYAENSSFHENLSDVIDLEASRRDINPNGVHVAVRDRLVSLATEDLNVSFGEQQKFDLPPRVTMLTRFEAEVMGQLLMNELSCDGTVPSEVLHYWIDVFQFMGPDYFNTLKKLVAKLEWTV